MKGLTKTLIRYLIIGIVGALGIGPLIPIAWPIFYEDTNCHYQLAVDTDTALFLAYQHSLSCAPFPKAGTQNASSVRILNPNSCVVQIFQEKTCENLIAYAMHWDGEPSCFPLSGAEDGTYYVSIGCLPLASATP
jgi:hypothetical protein